jgi:hypothetical protein
MPSPKAETESTILPSLGHAASGATGTVISTLLTYPLDLVNTRLKVQRQLRLDGAIAPADTYAGTLDAFQAIYAREGGIGAFFAGLGVDVGKSAADSFLFFLFYTVGVVFLSFSLPFLPLFLSLCLSLFLLRFSLLRWTWFG